MNNIQILEDKITKVIDRLKTLKSDKDKLNGKISELNEALLKKDEELRAARQDLKNVEALKNDIDKLTLERETVRSQVEALLQELESVEI
ncbi:MAG: hypothetical protein JSW20_09145 [Nitrospiraceae bacterium]|nr:MAG: hypothetical protein JSW20_09145 [Nitrospiraceae bacterium]